jgi:hypothetical protein
MKWLIVLLSITAAFNNAVAQSMSTLSKQYSAADSAEMRKHPPTAPVFYKDVKPETSSDTDVIYKRRHFATDASMGHAAMPSAPVPADSQSDYPKPRQVKLETKPNEESAPTAPVFKPRH